jgi:hypothetical protein
VTPLFCYKIADELRAPSRVVTDLARLYSRALSPPRKPPRVVS